MQGAHCRAQRAPTPLTRRPYGEAAGELTGCLRLDSRHAGSTLQGAEGCYPAHQSRSAPPTLPQPSPCPCTPVDPGIRVPVHRCLCAPADHRTSLHPSAGAWRSCFSASTHLGTAVPPPQQRCRAAAGATAAACATAAAGTAAAAAATTAVAAAAAAAVAAAAAAAAMFRCFTNPEQRHRHHCYGCGGCRTTPRPCCPLPGGAHGAPRWTSRPPCSRSVRRRIWPPRASAEGPQRQSRRRSAKEAGERR
jgi:hypothetical protein